MLPRLRPSRSGEGPFHPCTLTKPTETPVSNEDPLIRKVLPDQQGVRLDVFVAQQPEIAARPWARHLVEGGHVQVDSALAKPGLKLQPGWTVSITPVPMPSRIYAGPGPLTEDIELPVLYEDASIAVIDKPPGLSAHPPDNPRFVGHTVSGLSVTRWGELPDPEGLGRPGIVHRLDRDTSGVMVVAKTEQALHYLKGEFRARHVKKEYLALGYGEARFDSDWIEKRIGVDPGQGDRMTVVGEDLGRDAATFYEVLERFDGFTFFCCKPRTGRTHQIRVHMMSIGHSLIGDRQYRSRRNQHAQLPDDAPDPGRHFLHASRLSFRHPRTLETLEVEAPLPAPLAELRTWLRTCRPKD